VQHKVVSNVEPFQCFESNVDPVMRFMVDTGVVGAGWIRLPRFSYRCRSGNELKAETESRHGVRYVGTATTTGGAGGYTGLQHSSSCQIEVDVHFSQLVVLAPENDSAGGDNTTATATDARSSSSSSSAAAAAAAAPAVCNSIAPLLLASFDIECIAGSGSDGPQLANVTRFPSAAEPDDAVVLVATTLQRHGEEKPFLKHVLTWKSCASFGDQKQGSAGPVVASSCLQKAVHAGMQVIRFEQDAVPVEVWIVEDEAALLLAWRNFIVQVMSCNAEAARLLMMTEPILHDMLITV